MLKMNKKFYLSVDFWLWLIIFATSVGSAVHINLNRFDWYAEAAFTMVGLIGLVYTLFLKRMN